MSILIKLGPTSVSGFAEDKDTAKKIRTNNLMPSFDRGEEVILDFSSVTYATQSFIHALIGEAINKHGEKVLDLIQFKNCSSQLQSLIALVVDYSLGGFSSSEKDVSQDETDVHNKES